MVARVCSLTLAHTEHVQVGCNGVFMSQDDGDRTVTSGVGDGLPGTGMCFTPTLFQSLSASCPGDACPEDVTIIISA